MDIIAINKEDIKDVKFPAKEVLISREEREERNKELHKAMLLGNNYKGKIKIFFETTEGPRKVETTVWVATDSAIGLKGDVFIPIHCIHRVEI